MSATSVKSIFKFWTWIPNYFRPISKTQVYYQTELDFFVRKRSAKYTKKNLASFRRRGTLRRVEVYWGESKFLSENSLKSPILASLSLRRLCVIRLVNLTKKHEQQ